MTDETTDREWYCEAVAVGMEREAGVCSPDRPTHNSPCGWLPLGGGSVTDETTNPNRWTAEVQWESGGADNRRYAVVLYDGGRYIGKPVHGMEKDCNAFAEQINRPAPTTPADDLPPGVERISDGTLWLRRGEWRVPNGWAWECRLGEWSTDMGYARRLGMVQVRPIIPAEPATEWVPWWEAVGYAGPDGAVILSAVSTVEGEVVTDENGRVLSIDADGKVEVQR